MSTNALASARRHLRARRGANMVEYIILVGVVALMCILAFGKFGDAVTRKVGDQTSVVQTGINGAAN